VDVEEKEPALVEIDPAMGAAVSARLETADKGTLIARYLDSSGVFVRQYELCAPHTERPIIRIVAAG